MDASLYQPLFLWITAIWAVLYGFRSFSSSDYMIQMERTYFLFPLLISLVFVFWIGGRPVSYMFGDTVNYALSYSMMPTEGEINPSLKSEWVWFSLMLLCKQSGFDIHAFFTIVEAGYILSVLWAVKRFMPTNAALGMLFVFTSLMFFTFGTNGLRNGLACHIILLAMSFFFDEKYIIGGLLCLVALGIHRSAMLPIAGMLTARFILKDIKYAILVWIGSIFVSLAVGDVATNFFASLGFDDRMSSYNTTIYANDFSHAGFRWDFLLYSAFPILMGWYVCVKKNVKDDWYKTLCITYCLCNAFWVLIIRIAFSNRFAYLSWFMYPIIIAYPLVNLPVWDDQDRKTAQILLTYAGFTLFMQGFYWGI